MTDKAAFVSPSWNLDTPLRKTAKGVAEIQTRMYRLQPRLRSALILVDGRRRGLELTPLISSEPETTLRTLVELGFIEPTEAPAPLRPAPVAAPATAAPASESFETQRRAAVRMLNDLLGPAAETLAIRMERARDVQEWRPQLASAIQAIGSLRGIAAAEAFAARFAGR
ncbi:MAG TPA: hypothetical protein PLA97_17745 [Rubrivivax sp.]|nr:hypothetical protein [Rubrivivax sp.]